MINLTELEPQVPKALIEDYVWLVYGRAKAGKTSLFYELTKKHFKGDMSKSLLIGFEKGYKALKGLMAQDVNNYEEYIEVVDQLVDNRDELPFRWIGLDTLDVLVQYATEYIVKKERIARKDAKIKTIADIPWGGGYALLSEELIKQTNRLINAGYGLFMITHDQDKKFESRDGKSYDKTTMSLPNRVRNTFVNISDFIVFLDIEKKEGEGKKMIDNRYIHFRSDSDIEAGSRFKNVPDKIEYDAGKFLSVFEDAVLSSFDEDEEALETAKETQAIEKEEKAKEFVESEKIVVSDDEIKNQIAAIIAELDKDSKDAFKADLKKEFGTFAYKNFESQALVEALEIANSHK